MQAPARLVPIALALLLAPTLVVAVSPAPEAPPCPGFQDVPYQGPSCPVEGGWQVLLPDGTSVFTHGPDPAPRGATHDSVSPLFSTTSSPAVACVSDPSSQFHNLLVYAVPVGRTNRSATIGPLLRSLVNSSSAFLQAESAPFGARYKFRCDSPGVPTMAVVSLSVTQGSASFSSIVADLRAKGYGQSPYVNHWVWYDGTMGTVAGQATLTADDRLTSVNSNSRGGDFALTYGYSLWDVMMHESGHNLGAVQASAPHTSGAGHCTDGEDVMCYADGGPFPYTPLACPNDLQWDCNKDDYFNADPAPGSYLATHWNIGHPFNRFIDQGRPNMVPAARVTCTPQAVAPGGTVNCTMDADDDSDGIVYDVSVDGGAPVRAPATGKAIAGVPVRVPVTLPTLGAHTISVTATDDGSPAQSTTVSTTAYAGCRVLRSARLLAGLQGVEVSGVSMEVVTLPAICATTPGTFTLTGAGANFNVCWQGASGPLGCHAGPGDESGTIPAGAIQARIVLVDGLLATYAFESVP